MPDRFGNYVQFQSSDRPAPPDATRIAPVAPDEPIEVSIYLRPRDATATPPAGEADARAALRADREHAYRDDIRLVADFAAANGLTVVMADAARRLVRLSGPASRMEQAFRTSLHRYRGTEQEFRGRSGVLHLPQELANIVESVLGLDTRPIARTRLVRPPMRRRRRRTCRTSSPPSTISRRASTAAARRSR